MRIRRSSHGRIVCHDLGFATSLPQRMRGLIGQAAMDPDEGLFIPTASIHMMFIRFAIDALFVGPADDMGLRTVLAVRNRLPPWRGMVLPVRGAAGVVELPAGTVLAASLGRGDRVRLEPSLV